MASASNAAPAVSGAATKSVANSLAAFAATPGRIRWRTGLMESARQQPIQAGQAIARSVAGGTGHFVIQFDRPVDDAMRADLSAAGVTLLNYLGDYSFFASASQSRLVPSRLSRVAGLRNAQTIQPNWKMHPLLLAGKVPNWAYVGAAAKLGLKEGVPPDDSFRNAVEQERQNPNAQVAAYVLFHPDVRLDPDGVRIATRHGALVRDRLSTVNGLVIELPASSIPLMAGEDRVEWIEPPLPRMGEVNDSNRAITGANIVQAAPYGLDGSGVNVLVYDAGTARATHQDFGGRVTVRDASGMLDHSTHCSGTIGGSGAASGGVRKGMAPGVTIQSYGFQYDGTGIFLYTNPGDIQADYNQAVNTFGAVIASNSIGTNTETNGFDCAIQGDYGVTDTVIDGIVRGSLGAPMRVLWANGNERQGTRCNVEGFGSYYSTAPPATAKNHITCGALNSNDDSMTSFSSWGPVDDGRMKPDISGPGCQSNDDLGVTSTVASSDTAYASFCGTSMATPTVCGLSALLLQDFRAHFPALPDFRNSTLKIFWAHTAVDLGNAGPDYQFGYGSVRVQAAVDFMRQGNFLENQVSQGQTYNVLVVVNPGDPVLKVTMAWDDPPGTPNVVPALINDLDLVVYDPSNTQRFPWTLNPTNPSAAAVQTQANHIDNIEQVFVNAPAPGAWRVEVHGTTVPNGPQPFSLCASPMLVNCSHQGVISLDRPKYPCNGPATIQVIDCDLNTDDMVAETINVTIASDSEPGGEVVTLTETGAQTALFRGTINLSTTDSAGVLHVAHGDTVTATYVDADDGMGGINVVRTATATVDCQPPVISNVQAPSVQPRSATITFDTDEPANGTVRYGLSCGSLTGTAPEAGLHTSHSINLTGLSINTTYYYVVDAVDSAGNAVTDDNGGSCYSFTTPVVPDFFTELFDAADNDLDNHAVSFVPNGSVDRYSACSYGISSLPTDPTGGTVISTWSGTADDGYSLVTLSGGAQVKLYGTSYNSFYVGTNGYITFVTSDTTYTETLAAHFGKPRIAALFDDLNPGTGGTVSWKQLADRAVVTWQNVPEYSTSNQNTFQIEMYFDGRITINWLAIAATDGLAGLSDGTGLSPDFFESDLTTYSSCPPLPPSASDGSAVALAMTSVNVTLLASDPNHDPLSYIITSLPAHGILGDPNGGQITSVPYTLIGGGNIVRYLPNLLYTSGPDSFQFKANDGALDSNLATISMTVGGRIPLITFPLNSDPGWTTMGQWAFGTPTGGGSGNHDPTGGFTGTKVYGYNLAGDYPNNLTPIQYLTTTAINCSAVSGAQLKFQRWLGVESATYDHASVDISTNGSTWTNVWQHTQTSALTDSSWQLQTFDISAIADGKPTVYIRWGMGTTDGSVTYPGWNIDDVEIWGFAPAPCAGSIPGDLNGDGLVNGLDISGMAGLLVDPFSGTALQRCAANIVVDNQIDGADRNAMMPMLLGP